MAPQNGRQWTVQGTSRDSWDPLVLDENAPVPELGDHDVLVHFHGASLNYRDLVIVKGMYPFPQRSGVVPASDGAGTVEEVGNRVTRFKPGDKVITLFNQAHLGGPPTPEIMATGVGGVIDGCLRQYGAFDENGLVHMPENLNFLEASTLTCAGLTAWNALYGLESRALKQGDVVLTQGAGGVSIFALQFAKSAGATVIATTSSDSKAATLKSLGADHVLNYKADPSWGETAKSLTPGNLGVDHIIEVGGPNTMAQSLNAIKMDGVISIIGFVGGAKGEKQPSFLECLNRLCTVRGLIVGSRLQMEDMCRAVQVNGIKPVVDERVFGLEEVREAYEYQWQQKHFGKVCIRIE